MSRKRPSVIDSLNLADETGAAAAPGNVIPSNIVPLQGVESPDRPKTRSNIQHTSIYVPKLAYRKIRDIANSRDCKPHDVIMEGIDLVLRKYGFPSIAELKKESQ
jgi:hypothetical protein